MKIVYLSPVPWASITQRPHFFIDAALKNDVEAVIWIDPYPTRFPNLGDFKPGRHAPEPVGMGLSDKITVVKPALIIPCEPLPFLFKIINLFAINHLVDEIKQFVDSSTILVMGKPSLVGLKLISKFEWSSVWYDAMDDFPQFYQGMSKVNMAKTENLIIKSVDKIFCSSHGLLDKFKHTNKAVLVLNACSEKLERLDLAQKNDKLTFGYIGTVAQWFDWQWVVKLAQLNPGSRIRIVGPVKCSIPTDLPENIFLEQAIEHSKVMSTIATFDVAIIPFLLNDITRCVDPVKYYEYRLANKDVISTPFGEMVHHHSAFLNGKHSPAYDVPNGTLYFPRSANEDLPNIPRWKDRFQSLFIKLIKKALIDK